jgi:hypothetical protein
VTEARRVAVFLAVVLSAALFASPSQASAPATWKSRMAAAERYAQSRAGTISFAVVDEAGRLHGSHARAVAPSASVLKAMLLVAYLRRHDVRHRPLEQWERDLLAPMIRRSDNAAATRMVQLVGEARLNALARGAGMEHFRLHWPIWGQSEITPRGQALYFHRIDRLLPSRHRHYAMRLLATVVPSQRWGVGRVAHAGWHLYFKGGWGSGTGLVDHQVALYRADPERFSLALFTRSDPDHDYGKETLRGLASRLLRGVPVPGRRLATASRAGFSAEAIVSTRPGCERLAIRKRAGSTKTFSTGAANCGGFRLALGGSDALWSWRAGGRSRLATAGFGSAAPVDLGSFGSSDPLGPLAGSGDLLAFAHGNEVSTVGGPDCSVAAEALAAGGGRLAGASGATITVFDPVTCAVVRSLHAAAPVTAVALDDGLVAALSKAASGRVRLEWFRTSSGTRLGKVSVSPGTLPSLSLGGHWILYRSVRATRVLRTGSGSSWTVWRPANGQLGARLLGRRVTWLENGNGRARLWTLRLPRDD